LEHLLVERQVSDQLLQLVVLGFNLAETTKLRGPKASALLLPIVWR